MTDDNIITLVNKFIKNDEKHLIYKVEQGQDKDKKWHAENYTNTQEKSEHSGKLRVFNSLFCKHRGNNIFYVLIEKQMFAIYKMCGTWTLEYKMGRILFKSEYPSRIKVINSLFKKRSGVKKFYIILEG